MNRKTVEDPRKFARSMARFEFGRVRAERASGRPERAAIALKRALAWRGA